MAKRDSFLLRIDPQLLCQLRRWAEDDLRSLNAQIEFLLRRELRRAGRLTKELSPANDDKQCEPEPSEDAESDSGSLPCTDQPPSSEG